jgi:ABC-type Zn2+ transport system substrate-binding protein/surface adhesin
METTSHDHAGDHDRDADSKGDETHDHDEDLDGVRRTVWLWRPRHPRSRRVAIPPAQMSYPQDF